MKKENINFPNLKKETCKIILETAVFFFTERNHMLPRFQIPSYNSNQVSGDGNFLQELVNQFTTVRRVRLWFWPYCTHQNGDVSRSSHLFKEQFFFLKTNFFLNRTQYSKGIEIFFLTVWLNLDKNGKLRIFSYI